MTIRYSGTGIKRLEDFNLLTGRGCFTDDVHLPGMLHASFVRSSHAHARILAIDTAAAREMPGVRAVLTAADLPEALRTKPVPLDVPHPAIRYPLTPYMLAIDEVCYVGDNNCRDRRGLAASRRRRREHGDRRLRSPSRRGGL